MKEIATVINPYFDQDFFGFFEVMFWRLWEFGTRAEKEIFLAADEVQVCVLAAVAISSGLVGTLLVLRRMTMLANALSHTILFGIVVAYLVTLPSSEHGFHQVNISAMLIASVFTGIVTTFLTEVLVKVIRLQEDASIGLVFTTLFALGVVLVSLFTRNAHVGVEVVMGNVDALHVDDLKLVLYILMGNLVLFFFFYKEFKLTSFDPLLAKSLGFSTVFFNYLLMFSF